MAASTAITTVGSAQRRKFITHEVFTTRTTVSATAENTYLVYEIALFQSNYFKWPTVCNSFTGTQIYL